MATAIAAAEAKGGEEGAAKGREEGAAARTEPTTRTQRSAKVAPA